MGWIHALTALIVLTPSSGKPLPVQGHGEFSIPLPAAWKEAGRQSPTPGFPSVAFERPGKARGSLEITLVWSTKNDPTFTQPDNIHALVIAGQSAIRAHAVEREFPLRSIRGTAGQGFYYVATDRTYKLPASGVPVAGEYPILTHGELGLGTVVVSFTIFSDGKDDAAVQEALTALRAATLKAGR